VVNALGEKATTSDLNLKAPKASPAFTGTATADALTVSGALVIGTTNVATELNLKATTATLETRAPKASPIFTGTATAAALTVNGALLVGTTNVLSTLNLKANASDVYTKAQLEDKVQLKIHGFGVPLLFTENILLGVNTLSIDPTASLAIGNIAAASAEITNNCTIGGNCTITGALTVSGTTSFANPYWVAVVIGFVGGAPTIVRNGGRYAATSLIRVSGQATGIVQFDFPAHPQGTNYIISITASAGYGTIYSTSRTSTRFGITTRNISNVLFDTETHILISAY
jgi:hypothetical protein